MRHIPQAPDYPLFLMLDLFELDPSVGSYPKTRNPSPLPRLDRLPLLAEQSSFGHRSPIGGSALRLE